MCENKNELKISDIPNATSVALQLLEYYEKHYPEIVFDIAFQFIGHLRSAEISKLSKKPVNVNKSINSITITFNFFEQAIAEAHINIDDIDMVGRLLTLYEKRLLYINTHSDDVALKYLNNNNAID